MDVRIGPLRKKDFDTARKFAIEGMHLTWYTGNQLELFLYSKYFWCLEISRATSAFGAYIGDALAGVLLADINHRPKIFKSFWYTLYVNFAAFVIHLAYKAASSAYDDANKKMLQKYQRKRPTDGELNFFAVDPGIQGKGLGTLLLNELAAREKGKHIYLFTDSGATYQFYSHRGFDEVGREDITLTIHGKDVPLNCLLFSKTL